MIVWMVADRALDIIGLATLIYWAWRVSKWWYSKPVVKQEESVNV